MFGYELLFRDGVEDYFRYTDADAASRSTLDTSMLMGLDVLCDGRRAFINCTRETLLRDYVTLLPPTQAVVEILESVPVDDLVKAACVRLKEAGYTIALDDFVADDPRADELAATVRNMGLKLPVIFMSGYADRSLDAGTLGNDGIFLQKPFSLATLARAVRSALEEESEVATSTSN